VHHVQRVEPYAAARAWHAELGLDYGKIDYTVRAARSSSSTRTRLTGRATYLTAGTLGADRRRQARGGIQSYFAGLNSL
jgi:hypothetical protein